jgi:hypothetical protein
MSLPSVSVEWNQGMVFPSPFLPAGTGQKTALERWSGRRHPGMDCCLVYLNIGGSGQQEVIFLSCSTSDRGRHGQLWMSEGSIR